MASKMKNLFHRKKDDLHQQPSDYSLGSDLTLRASLYETTTPAGLPQVGDYPIKGNDSSLMLQQGPGRKLSLRSRRSSDGSRHNALHRSPTPDQYVGRRTPRMDPSPGRSAVSPESDPPYQPRGQDEMLKRRSQPLLAREFANLNLGNEGPTTVTHTVTTTHFAHNGPRYTTQPQAYTPTNSSSARPVSQRTVQLAPSSKSYKAQPPSSLPLSDHVGPNRQPEYGRDVPRLPKQQQHDSGVPMDGYEAQNRQPEYGRDVPRLPKQQQQQDSGVPMDGYEAQNYQPEYGRDVPRPQKQQQNSRVSTDGYEAQNRQPEVSGRDGARSSVHQPLPYNMPVIDDGDRDRQPNYGRDTLRKPSIPRKEVGGSSTTPNQISSSPQTRSKNDLSQIRTERALPPVPVPTADRSEPRRIEPSTHSISHDGYRPASQETTGYRSAQDVVARAKTNTKDTDVIETVAPAVIHEEVHKEVHHIREELITREIHNHDVYHRVLPVIDVEVLPPRHFLPVEGGGLVEISGQEVPGRGNHWVIAETASKIPSGQAAPSAPRMFTAREFRGREGDAVRYTAPEGHEKTEQTWVHPPELETGARDTGQSWPMVFGDGPPVKGSYGYTSPKASRKRTSKRGSAVAPSQRQQADGHGPAA